MHDKTHQAISLANHAKLFLPKVNRILAQDVNERVVLDGCQREFKNISYEEGHHGAATAPFRLQVRDIWQRHIVGELERVVPIQLAIHRPGAETLGMILTGIVVDYYCPPQKLLPLMIQPAVVVQIVDIELKPAAFDLFDILIRNLVALFGNYLKGRFDSMRFVEVHQLRAEVAADGGFDVVRHD